MSSRRTIAQYLQYAYFLRISLLFWLFLPALCLLDLTHVTAALSRGILTLDSSSQWFWAVFFVVATNMAVLITARNIAHNGEARFLALPPARLYRFLTDDSPRAIWIVLALAHMPTASTLLYLLLMARHESEKIDPLPILAGFVVSLCFWYLVSLFYYWSYRSPSAGEASGSGREEPAALIFPKYNLLFGDIEKAEPPPRLMAWIGIVTGLFLRRVSCSGYAATNDGPVWELHFLSGLSLAGVLAIYSLLYPLTSPVLRSAYATYGQIAFCLLVTALFLWSIAHTGVKSRWGGPVRHLFTVIALCLASIFVAALEYDRHTESVRMNFAFPTLASILVLLGFLLWLFAGVAFFLDRYRVPVLTVFLAFIFLPKMAFGPLSEYLLEHDHPRLAEIFDSDHYFSVLPQATPVNLNDMPTPSSTLKLLVTKPDDPYIIVTASGGGIQAAEWTAQVMASLEKQFASDPLMKDYKFHDHILLASGVSGGSGGLLPFLLEYTAPPDSSFPADKPALFDRITRPPGCSSLEAVGWGLSYHDFSRLLLPISFPRALNDDDSPDRSWALASAFNRNLHDRHCGTERSKPTQVEASDFTTLPMVLDGGSFTLRDAAKLLSANRMPAFSFNTTAAETGGRFLLSNYYVRPSDSCDTDFSPAESFLQVYGTDPQGYVPSSSPCYHAPERPRAYADLPLATAARLSATFPLVSSGTRIPLAYSRHGYHFLDGGYFDNDGTSSAIEFLKSALDDHSKDAPPVPRRILWIEIRDDDGASVGADEDDLANQNGMAGTGKKPASSWTPLGQLTGIAQGLWNAGHESISRRNRRELCTFERAYSDRIHDLHHVVLTIPSGADNLSPLSWNLTTGQQASITKRANETSGWIHDTVVPWVATHRGPGADSDQEVCRNNTEPPSPIKATPFTVR